MELSIDALNRLRSELLSRLGVVAPKSATASIDLNSSMRTTAGRANYTRNMISLNTRLLGRNLHHVERTFTHELAHLVAVELYGREARGHGMYWQRIMTAFGVEAIRCHKLDTTGLKRQWRTYAAACSCRTHMIKSGRRNKITRGTNYRCKLCKTMIQLVHGGK